MVSDFFLWPIAGEFISSIVIPKSRDTDPDEMLSLNMASGELSGLLQRVELPNGYLVAIVDAQGVIGARSQNHNDGYPIRPPCSFRSDGGDARA